ncbi:aquaporin NIP3-3-like isoform X2 [Panicum virgatum]|uniref:Uncharacterized protein n=3 Tax=Panicum virgatum TaxID=38727 RepID=A0A8T0R7M9_PANVG|nr:aquaporin NIP3-3-like isoform X2 [Panicum virgatum]XP_039852831.1 aquaporin NIP3-3-like isoform X2 [Panicum virgatum]XP_039852832.1 aquaporin NIP3-3-like isoform X2 [Panicum virgatum]XP_039852833.1 aquaporin NIP3-3-like isoform X2 [Panicum virgatum]KAG2581554.1 hypothetical protein PVAP13_6KG053400 [Panicum virgatum]
MPCPPKSIQASQCPHKSQPSIELPVHCTDILLQSVLQLEKSSMEQHMRSISRDLTLSISRAASMDDMSADDKIAIIVPHSSPILSTKSPSNHTLPQWVQSEASRPPPSMEDRAALALVRKVAAEFLGTFLLVFTLLSALIVDEARGGALGLLGVAVAAGSAVAVIVASLAHVSGAHLNPAVSTAMAAFGYLPGAHLLPYVAAQLLGSTAASFAARAVYEPPNLGATAATVPALGTAAALAVEFVTTFVLLFVITALSTDPKAVKELLAVGAGAAVMMGALISAETTGASMNPARTLGPAIAAGTYTKIWIYMVAPPLGAIAGTGAYVALM